MGIDEDHTTVQYSISPTDTGIVERMNSVIGQMLRCTLHEMNDVKNWLEILPIVELAINSSPNHSIGYSPFFLNYGYDITVPADLVSGDKSVQ